jgi:hypothetical protein
LQNTNTLFSDTRPDASIRIETVGQPSPKPDIYAFRAATGKAIIAYWLPVLSKPGVEYDDRQITLRIDNSRIQNPVLVDVTSGKLTRVSWKAGSPGTLDHLPLRDSVIAIADESYFDWPELPEAPSELNATIDGTSVRLTWRVNRGHPQAVFIERRAGRAGAWQAISTLPAATASFTDKPGSGQSGPVSYRVRAGNANGRSAYSNVATLAQFP